MDVHDYSICFSFAEVRYRTNKTATQYKLHFGFIFDHFIRQRINILNDINIQGFEISMYYSINYFNKYFLVVKVAMKKKYPRNV